MNALLILIPITLVLAGVAVAVFFWAVGHQQFEDLDTPKILPLLDEPPATVDGVDPTPSADVAPDTAARRPP